MGTYYDENVLSEINHRIDILDVVSESVKLSRKGDRYWGLCPFHAEKTPSFSVTPGKNMFYCFGCHAGGNLFTYVMKRDGLEFPEAVQLLASRAGVQLQSTQFNKGVDRFKRVVEVNKAAAAWFQGGLEEASAAKARQYLLKRRLDEETVKRFQVGYAPNEWNRVSNYLLGKGFDQEWVKESGLIKRNKSGDAYYDLFRDRIIFPIFDYQGNIVGFGGRILEDQVPKYLNTPETEVYVKRHHLYGLYQAREAVRKENQVILVEGYMDCLKLHQHGVNYAVASLGTALTREQTQLLRRYAENVLVLYDGDEAGQRETLRAVELLAEQGFNVEVLTLPAGQDPDDFLDEHGKEEFLQYIQNNRVSYIEFKVKRSIAAENSLNLQAKIRVINAVKDDIKSLESGILRDNYTKMLSRLLKIEENLILKEIEGHTGPRKQYLKNKSPVNRDNIQYGNYSMEEKILANMLHNRDIAEIIASNIGLECFSSRHYNRLAAICYEMYGFSGTHSLELQQAVQGEGLEALLARLDIRWDEGFRLNDAELWYFIRGVQRQRYRARWRNLHQRLEHLRNDGGFHTVLRLILDLDTFLHQTREGGIQ
ncbi:MAG TPA: DNA primase [Syntrophomonas sp.]|jgi:DNA primase|nr:DNA primase [Syntrophomonas sp.]